MKKRYILIVLCSILLNIGWFVMSLIVKNDEEQIALCSITPLTNKELRQQTIDAIDAALAGNVPVVGELLYQFGDTYPNSPESLQWLRVLTMTSNDENIDSLAEKLLEIGLAQDEPNPWVVEGFLLLKKAKEINAKKYPSFSKVDERNYQYYKNIYYKKWK
jgi:hypothetical protein